MGGGAFELIAVNDIIIGRRGILSVDGGDGSGGAFGGGGGSGGTVLLSAGGTITVHGTVSARGGRGGAGVGVGARGGGGGGGGRLASYAQALNVEDANLDVGGGAGALDNGPEVVPATPYIGQIGVRTC